MPDPETTVTAPDRRADVRWGLGDAALGWVLAQIGGAIAVAIVLAINDDIVDFEDLSLAWVAVAQLGLWIGMLGVPLVASKLKGQGPVRDYGLRSEGWDAPVGFAAGVLTQLLLIPLLYGPIFWLTDLDANDLEDPARGLSDRATGTLGVTMLILIVGIGAPVVEEIFYRGLLQRSLERRFGVWPAILGSALLFGVSHFQLLQLPALVLFGIVLGLLAQRTGRLAAPIAAHIVFNMTTVLFLIGS
ncbi:MAG: lysostaphin resistance A-like protein [Acidimicrobiales bacterium]